MSKARTLADFISDGSEFADGTISVAEVSGAAPLASPTFTGTASGTFSGPLTGDVTGNVAGNLTGNVTGDVAGDIDLSAIAATIADTAVDIFVYDTRKDSDGGAWRKRTQHTSWYNETLNTATRGSRKEFPAVAVIVVQSDELTIYDGDDPDLPMWMVFEATVYTEMLRHIQSSASCFMLNGMLASATGTNEGVILVDFISDVAQLRISGGSSGWYKGNISERNANKDFDYGSISSTYAIVNDTVNDVAMTVLPNAPIDAATGLPVPTIAVATDGGVSVIKDDGTVVDGVYTGGNSDSHTIALKSDGTIAWTHENGPYFLGKLWEADWSTGTGVNVKPRIDGSMFYPAASGDYLASVGLNTTCTINAAGSSSGLTKVDVPSGSDASVNGMVNFITSDYNTGWMNGDIKLATLSDTDDTNVTDTNLVTNGTFNSNIDGWSSSGAAISWDSSGRLKLVSSGSNLPAYYPISCEIGKRYYVQLDFEGSWSFHLGTETNSANDVGYIPHEGTTGNVTRHMFFTATQTTHYLVPYVIGANTAYVDNVIVTLAEDDRSVNGGYRGNGLQVFGTVTKSAVATGADLVGYSGFSGTDYLKQPYNSDLDFGITPFSVTAWFKTTSQSTDQYIFDRSTDGSPRVLLLIRGTSGNDADHFQFYVADASANASSIIATDFVVTNNVWTHVCAVFDGSTYKIFINGEQSTAIDSTPRDIANDNSPLWIGTRFNQTSAMKGSIALLRFSATAPSPDQIKKIYEDEKVLFQENAQATLYGSSDAVTALAYDDSTELLHVGTSAGRSVFQGLRRVDNTTNAVGSAISASNGLVADE